MRISRMLKRILMPARRQEGFSIVEVMMAGLVLAMVSMPMMQMFSASLQITQLTDDYNKVQVCTRSYAEMVRALPFWKAYNGTDRDVDDFFWGDGRGINNNWSTAPEVVYKAYGTTTYPQFKVTVKMVYLTSDLAEATMMSKWGPKKPSYDQPLSSDNTVLHMIKYEVKAYWQSSTGGEKNFSTTAIRTDTAAEIGLLITTCTNTSADATKHGSRYGEADDNTAPHTKDSITVNIKGKGFVKSGITTTVKLAMDKNADIPMTITSITNTEIIGTINLSSGGTTGFGWSPKRTPGGWAVMVFLDRAFEVLYEGFIVEFPTPKLTVVSPTTGKDTASALSIVVTGSPILSLGGTCKAVLRLVKKNADGTPDASKAIDSTAVATVTTTGTAGYTTSPNYITATFNLTGEELGEYYLWVINCKDYGNLGDLGNVTGSSQNATAGAFVFTIIQVPPSVTNVYETASPNRTYGFNNRTYNLTIKGSDFDTANGVTVYLGRPNAAPAAPRAQGTSAIVSDASTITANFNLSALAGNEGQCWAYVQNNGSGLSGSKASAFEVRRPPRVTTVSNVDTDTRVAGTFKYNYYDIDTQLTGQDFYSGYQVYYQKSTGGTTYQVGVNDGAETFAYSNGTTFNCELNLIDLPVGTYNIWVADASDSTNATSASFACEYGAPILFTESSPYSTSSVTIRSRRSSSTYQSSESGTSLAFARSGAQVKFMLTGMGFLDSTASNKTNVNIGTSSNLNGDFTASSDRAAKTVVIYTLTTAAPQTDWDNKGSSYFMWTLPTVSSNTTFNIVLTNPAGFGGSKTYTGRWQVKSSSNPPAW